VISYLRDLVCLPRLFRCSLTKPTASQHYERVK